MDLGYFQPEENKMKQRAKSKKRKKATLDIFADAGVLKPDFKSGSFELPDGREVVLGSVWKIGPDSYIADIDYVKNKMA